VKTIALSPASDRELVDFSIDQLIGKKYFKVLRLVSRTNHHVVLEYDESELTSPAADPLIVGTVNKTISSGGVETPDYVVRALWESKLWRSLDKNTEELLDLLAGVKPVNMKKFAEQLRAGDYPRPRRVAGGGTDQGTPS
jgi:hypothetical protein